MPPARAPVPNRERRFVPWRDATRAALYGPGGFYHQPAGPAGHFRTSVHASPLFATAVLRVLRQVDAGLGHPARIDLVDVGAGRGELVAGLLGQLTEPGSEPDPLGLVDRLRVTAVEVAVPGTAMGHRAADARTPTPEISWVRELPGQVTGLVIANEWLDTVPVDVVEAGPDHTRMVLVEPATGVESTGDPVGGRDAAWLARWWPPSGARAGDRAEVGWPRDEAWAGAVRSLRAGVAVAVDYGHLRADRVAGRYAGGTMVGYHRGRTVPPVPDGTVDITAHVAVDAAAAAGRRAGARSSALVSQRSVLGRLGLGGPRPPLAVARADPAAYARALQHASMLGELTDPAGLGGFWWLAQSVGVGLPAALSCPAPGGVQSV